MTLTLQSYRDYSGYLSELFYRAKGRVVLTAIIIILLTSAARGEKKFTITSEPDGARVERSKQERVDY